jgi:hypothetical protein
MTDETDSDERRETDDEEFAWGDTDGADDDLAWADVDSDDSGSGDDSDDLAWADADEERETDVEPFPAPADDTGSSDVSGDQDPLATPDAGDEGSELAGPEMDEAFDDMAVDDVETDEVWSDVTEADEEKNLPAETEPADQRVDGSSIAEVSKHDYCEGCEYFSEAPEIHCTHDGTEILDFLDMETVRLSDCPIVAEREGLEGEGVAKGSTSISDMSQD